MMFEKRGTVRSILNPSTSLRVNLSLILFTLTALLLDPISALADSSLPAFAEFSRSVQNGQKDTLRGVYVEDTLALPVVQQPSGKAGYVSNNDGKATQFGMASQYGNVGLLAHNHLAGKFFSQLAIGQQVRLVYGDGRVEYFTITEILKYQALQPNSPYSAFKDLDKDETLSAGQMFKRAYVGDRRVTFQTCIEADGQLSWGRLFVIAMPSDTSQSGR